MAERFSRDDGECTLWACVEPHEEGPGRVLLAKNRDSGKAELEEQVLRLVRPARKGRQAFFGLFSGVDTADVKFGINERRLVVASASFPNDRPKRGRWKKTAGLNRKLLQRCGSIDDVLAHARLLRGPRFLMIGEPGRIACVEIAPGGALAVTVIERGHLAHTNHFLASELTGFNTRHRDFRPGEEERGPLYLGSQRRLRTVRAYLDGVEHPTCSRFERWSACREHGRSRSLWRWRAEGKATGIRTVCSLVADLRRVRPPRLIWLLPGDESSRGGVGRRHVIELDELFARDAYLVRADGSVEER